MSIKPVAVIVLAAATGVLAQAISYECDLLPAEDGWNVQQNFCDTEEWVDSGVFLQYVETCEWTDPPQGQQSSYWRPLTDLIGTDPFAVEFRVATDGDASEIPFSAPATLSVFSQGPTNYLFTIASDVAQLWRDNSVPIVDFDIEAGLFHTFRLELFGDESFVLYIDGDMVNQGTPEGVYPSFNPKISFRAKKQFVDSTAEWDYIRWGKRPTDSSGDWDSSGTLDLEDFYFFAECGAERGNGPDVPVDPGCEFADMDADGDVDLHDFAVFQQSFTGK